MNTLQENKNLTNKETMNEVEYDYVKKFNDVRRLYKDALQRLNPVARERDELKELFIDANVKFMNVEKDYKVCVKRLEDEAEALKHDNELLLRYMLSYTLTPEENDEVHLMILKYRTFHIIERKNYDNAELLFDGENFEEHAKQQAELFGEKENE